MLPWTIIHWTQFTNAISHIVTLNLAVQVTMMQMWTILKTTTMIGSTTIILSMMTTVWNIHMEYEREKGEIMDFRDKCQGASKTGSVHDVWVPVELRHIYKGSLKGNRSLLNA